MGASDSKLVFKQGIFRLSEDKIIPADDPYWASVGLVNVAKYPQPKY
jgi:High-temperature-induced dauer-formation protein